MTLTTKGNPRKVDEFKDIMDGLNVIFSEIESGYYKEALKTTSQLKQSLRKGFCDVVCPNCNCIVELVE